jgi:hypothetical protein
MYFFSLCIDLVKHVIYLEQYYYHGLDDRGSRVRFQAGAGNFSLHYRVQNGSGAHPASYPMGTMDSFPGGKAARGLKLTTRLHLVPR